MKFSGGVLIIAIFALTACGLYPASKDASESLLKGCADSDINSKSVLYFGPSNQIGPGSVWSRLGSSGGYQPQWRLQDLGMDSRVIDVGKSFSCDLSQNTKFVTSASLSVISSVASASAEAKADFSHARVVKVSTTGAAWDTLVGGLYVAQLKSVVDPEIRTDVSGVNRIILRRALRLDGYRVTLEFDSSVASEIKTKYSGKILRKETVGDVGAELSATWSGGNNLELVAADSVYVAGEFAQITNGEWTSTRGSGSISDLGDRWVLPYKSKQ